MTDLPCVQALLNYEQADADGTMVRVSRQAVHEVAELARRGAAAGELLEAVKQVEEIGFVRAKDAPAMHDEAIRVLRAAIAQFEATAATQETRNG